jgi:uncharacterized membrane protein
MNSQIKLGKMVMFSTAVILLMCALSAWAWGQIPDSGRVPTHWNAHGDVDGYSPKGIGLYLMPVMIVGLVALLSILPKITPRREHLLKSLPVYKTMWIALLVFFAAIHGAAVFTALGRSVPMSAVILAGLGFLFIIIGNWLGKVRSNFIMGMRTPWTLASELSWNKTHRLSGKLFVGVGAVFVVLGFFFSTQSGSAVIMVGGLLLLVIVPTIYSWWVWKNDPNRQS